MVPRIYTPFAEQSAEGVFDIRAARIKLVIGGIYMSKELAKTYDPHGLEDRIYEKWLEKKYFHAEVDRSKKPFTIVIPAPKHHGTASYGACA